MSEKIERLNKLDNVKLIDVVKNYRQYGYDDELRTSAISLLNERGVSKEQLQLTGGFENKTYDYAQELFASFNRNSKVAFVLYGILIVTIVLVPVISSSTESLSLLLLLILYWCSLIGYLLFLIKSFISQNQFYKAINKGFGTEGALLYLLLGMPLYLIMYFYFKSQMEERMKEII